MEDQKYYYIAIDKLQKTIQLCEYSNNSCDAREYEKIADRYNITDVVSRHNMQTRFSIFFNNTKNYIDYAVFYKKYAKFTVLSALLINEVEA
jgi:hypothetical protein